MIEKDYKRTHARNLHALGLAGPDADANASTQKGVTALMRAAAKGNIFVVKCLLAMGAKINAEIEYNTPLLEACHCGQTKIVRLLLSRGADVNQTVGLGYTPLMAAEWGHEAIAEALLRKGADVNAVEGWGRTALNTAAIDYWNTIPLLLRYGADIHAGNDSALRTALQAHNPTAAKLLRSYGARLPEDAA